MSGPNYQAQSVASAASLLATAKVQRRLLIDCSHGNSNKDHEQQVPVAKAVLEQVVSGDTAIAGLMLESYLVAGKQTLAKGVPLRYGQSITDACLAWDETEAAYHAYCAETARST